MTIKKKARAAAPSRKRKTAAARAESRFVLVHPQPDLSPGAASAKLPNHPVRFLHSKE